MYRYGNHNSLLTFFSRYLVEGNNLDGTIPREISSLKDLEFLGMERGNLMGQIPSSLSSLTKLFFLDLDFNSLSGKFLFKEGSIQFAFI